MQHVSGKEFLKILIANRREIAIRVLRAANIRARRLWR
jgi:pyruvate carboxylase